MNLIFYDPVTWGLTVVLGSIALNDALYGRIEHRSLGALLALYGIQCATHPPMITLASFIWFFSLLGIGFLFFLLGLWGGGDAKLLPVLSLWVHPADQWFFLFHVTCLGGIMAFLWLGWMQKIQWMRFKLGQSFRLSLRLMDGCILPSLSKQRHVYPDAFSFPYGVPLTLGLLWHKLMMS